MTRPRLPDEAARQRIAEDLDATLIVEAAAGTGKTTALVGRIVSVIRAGAGRLARMAAVTFTDKAAGEMRLRLREALEHARGSAPAAERGRLDAAIAELEQTAIGTIHSLCADLLRERPIEAGVDPSFEMAGPEDIQVLEERAFDQWFQAILADPPEGVRRLLRRRPSGRDDAPRTALFQAAVQRSAQRDYTAPWRRDPFDRDRSVDVVMEALAALGALLERGGHRAALRRYLEEIDRFCREAQESLNEHDYDDLEAQLRLLWRSLGLDRADPDRRGFRRESTRTDAPQELERAREALDAFVVAAGADVAACLHRELATFVDYYERLKDGSGRLDFVDLLVKTRDLVRDNPEVRAELQERFSHIFVDEFQDTDPLQTEILILLAAADSRQRDWRLAAPSPGKLFLVGDPKQSIYRFRRADVATYQAVKRLLVRWGAEVEHLTTSFRAVPSLQGAVNAAFAPAMRGGDGETSQAQYVPLSPHRDDPRDQPTLVVLPVPHPYGPSGVTFVAIRKSYPEAVAAFVQFLLGESGWTVYEKGERVPIQSQHICLLFKRFRHFEGDLTHPVVRALEARNVRHLLVGGRAFHHREEVAALRAALTAIEWPGDELSVLATLRGPLFSLLDDALLAYRHRFGRLNPIDSRDETDLPDWASEVREALSVLRSLHRGRNRRPIAETIAQLLRAVRAHAAFANWQAGEQALANVLRLQEMARSFERSGAPSFRAFIERLHDRAEGAETADAAIVEEGTEGVRIMTVHQAKGLEFPVVVLCDPTARAVPTEPTKLVDSDAGLWLGRLAGYMPIELRERRELALQQDDEEGVRLAYVAATRARDLLVVPAVGDKVLDDRWLRVLNPAIFPPSASSRHPERAPGCPRFGDDSVRERPDPRLPASMSVAPGSHTPTAGSHRVVWWDPALLDLEPERTVGLRRARLLAEDETGAPTAAGRRRYDDWLAGRARRIESGSIPTLPARPVTAIAESGEPVGGEVAVEVEEVADRDRARPRGARFGTVVHAVLADVALDADRPAIEANARVQGRLAGAPEDEVAAAATAVERALAHPLMRHAAARLCDGRCRREVPLALRLEGGEIAEGVADLAVRDEPGWLVIDYKTDLDLTLRRATYERQVRLYCEAIREATGEPARGVLLLV